MAGIGLEDTLKEIAKDHGKDAIRRMGATPVEGIPFIPTGAFSLDMALGIGGVPRGRITEIFGPESVGKSTLAQHIVANAQKDGGEVAYIDVEHAVDHEYAEELGVDVERLFISQPDSGEQALEITEALVRSGDLKCIVIDSVAALVTQDEIDGNIGDRHVAGQAPFDVSGHAQDQPHYRGIRHGCCFH